MKKPIDKDFDNIRDYMIAMEAYVRYLEDRVNTLEMDAWNLEIFQREQREREDC